jgi:hypothetical protein
MVDLPVFTQPAPSPVSSAAPPITAIIELDFLLSNIFQIRYFTSRL